MSETMSPNWARSELGSNRYGESSTTDFYCHHTIAVSLAVVISVAKAIEKGVGARTRKHVASTQHATPPSPP